MLVNITSPKGLMTKSNNTNPQEEYASDLLNVTKDHYGNIRKIKAFSKIIDIDDGCIDYYYYSHSKEILLFYPTGIKKVSNLSDFPEFSYVSNIFADSTSTINWTEKLSFAENGKNLYIADPSGNEELMKYDGKNLYRAGIPSSVISSFTAGTTYIRAFIMHKDYNGIETYGDYDQKSVNSANPIVVAIPDYDPTFTNPKTNGKYPYKYGYPEDTIILSANPSSYTFDFTGHNFEVGDVIWSKYRSSDAYGNSILISDLRMEVSEVNVNLVTFTYESEGQGTVTFLNAVSNLKINIASSTAATYGYIVDQGNNQCLSPNRPNSFLVGVGSTSVELNDIYDDTIIKGIPPKFRYISMFGEQMIGIAPKGNNLADTMYWSDLGVGSNVETFAPFDYQAIGKSDEGDGSGIFANTDHIVVFKKREVYFVFGILYGKQYRIVKANTSGIGCISHRTIKSLVGGCSFLSDKGVYFTSGDDPIEVSESIETVFSDITDKELSVLEIDYTGERAYLIFPSITYEYNFRFKEWFKNNLMSYVGLININDDKYIIKSSCIEKQSDLFDHEAYYKTANMVSGEPMLKKKHNSCSIVSAYGDSFSVEMSSYSNWSDIEVDSISTEQISQSNPIAKIEPVERIVYAKSYKIKGLNDDEDFVISSIGYEVEPYQSRVKDRK